MIKWTTQPFHHTQLSTTWSNPSISGSGWKLKLHRHVVEIKMKQNVSATTPSAWHVNGVICVTHSLSSSWEDPSSPTNSTRTQSRYSVQQPENNYSEPVHLAAHFRPHGEGRFVPPKSINQSINQSIYLSIYLTTYLPTHPPIHPPA